MAHQRQRTSLQGFVRATAAIDWRRHCARKTAVGAASVPVRPETISVFKVRRVFHLRDGNEAHRRIRWGVNLRRHVTLGAKPTPSREDHRPTTSPRLMRQISHRGIYHNSNVSHHAGNKISIDTTIGPECWIFCGVRADTAKPPRDGCRGW